MAIIFYPDNSTLYFSLFAETLVNNLDITAVININAYSGLAIVQAHLNLCDGFILGLLCPFPTIPFNGTGAYTVPSNFSSQIPSIAYTVPDLEAFATVDFIDSRTGETISCVQSTLSNGKSMYQPGVIWATVAMACLAALSSLLHTALWRSSGAAQWRVIDVMLSIQQPALVAMLSVSFTNAFLQYAKNFAWSVGLINILSVQESVGHLRNNTGGGVTNGVFGAALAAEVGRRINSTTPADAVPLVDVSLNQAVKIDLPAIIGGIIGNITGRPSGIAAVLPTAAEFTTHTLQPRQFGGIVSVIGGLLGAGANTTNSTSEPIPVVLANSTERFRGMEIYSENLTISPGNVLLTGLINYAILLAIVLAAGLVVLAMASVIYLLTAKKRAPSSQHQSWASRFVQRGEVLAAFLPALISRWLMIVLPPMLAFSFWQWAYGDSWAASLIAGLVLAVFLATFLAYLVPMVKHAHRAGTADVLYPDHYAHGRQHGRNSSATLDGEKLSGYHNKVAERVGILAHPYRSRFYWGSALYVAWAVLRAIFIGFAQKSGLAQVIGLLVIEVAGLFMLLVLRIGRDKKSDWVNVILSLFRLVAWALCIPLTTQVKVIQLPRIIIGFVLVAVTAIPIVLIFLLTVWDLFSPFCHPSFWRRRAIKNEYDEGGDSVQGNGFVHQQDPSEPPRGLSTYDQHHDPTPSSTGSATHLTGQAGHVEANGSPRPPTPNGDWFGTEKTNYTSASNAQQVHPAPSGPHAL